jgi:hypothetical protein
LRFIKPLAAAARYTCPHGDAAISNPTTRATRLALIAGEMFSQFARFHPHLVRIFSQEASDFFDCHAAAKRVI